MAAAMNWRAKVPVVVKLIDWLTDPVSLTKRACDPFGGVGYVPECADSLGRDLEIDRTKCMVAAGARGEDPRSRVPLIASVSGTDGAVDRDSGPGIRREGGVLAVEGVVADSSPRSPGSRSCSP